MSPSGQSQHPITKPIPLTYHRSYFAPVRICRKSASEGAVQTKLFGKVAKLREVGVQG
jgi:hypothetical protein